MAASEGAAASTANRQWYIVGRWQEFEGEGTANLLRIVAIGAFYTVELVQHYGLLAAAERESHAPFHQMATAVAAAWTLLALAVFYCLRNQIFPAMLKYASTTADLALLTALAAQMALPTSGPLVYVYFPVMGLAALRFQIRLVALATCGAMLGYLLLVGKTDTTWFDAEHATPVVNQLMMLVSLATTGMVLGHLVARMRPAAEEYAERMESSGDGAL